MGMVSSSGQMVPSTMDNGKIIKWMALENLNGPTVECMLVNTQTTRSMVKVPTSGQMEDSTRVDFIMVNNTVKVCTDRTMAKMFTAYG